MLDSNLRQYIFSYYLIGIVHDKIRFLKSDDVLSFKSSTNRYDFAGTALGFKIDGAKQFKVGKVASFKVL